MKLSVALSAALILRLADAYVLSPRAPLRRQADIGTPIPTATSTPTITTPGANGITTPSPVASGMTNNCNRFTLVVSRESVSFITDNYNITLDDFFAWNPSLSGDPDALQPWYYYCAGIVGDAPNPPPPTKTSSAVITPEPPIWDMLPYCSSFHLIGQGDTCWTIADAVGITVDKFAEINPIIDDTVYCNLWWGYYYCTAVTIPATSW